MLPEGVQPEPTYKRNSEEVEEWDHCEVSGGVIEVSQSLVGLNFCSVLLYMQFCKYDMVAVTKYRYTRDYYFATFESTACCNYKMNLDTFTGRIVLQFTLP